MGLDANIFFQGAALRQASDARTQQTINSVFDKLAATKLKKQELEQKKASDYEGSAYRVLMAQQAGVTPDPGDLARAKAFDVMNTIQNAVDPVTGNVYAKNRSLFDNLSNAPMTSPTAPAAGQPMGVDIAGLMDLKPMSEADLSAPYPKQGNVPLPPMGRGVDMAAIDKAMIDAPAPTGNRKLDQAAAENAQKMNMELQRDEIKRKTEPLSLEQGKIATFTDRIIEADKQIGTDLAQKSQLSAKERVAGEVPIVGNYLVSKNYQTARQAERNFINAVLRRESGAVISPEEFANARQQYFPQPGDLPDVIAQKANNRKTVIEGFQRESGPAYKPKDAASGVINWEDLP